MQSSELFIEVVRGSKELPLDVRAQADQASDIKETYFDKSYIEFLDEQISLNPRGPEWTEILRRRRESLLPFCNIPLLSGHIRSGQFRIWIKVDPKTRTIVFWEKSEYDAET